MAIEQIRYSILKKDKDMDNVITLLDGYNGHTKDFFLSPIKIKIILLVYIALNLISFTLLNGFSNQIMKNY
jgi:hypothetical protein